MNLRNRARLVALALGLLVGCSNTDANKDPVEEPDQGSNAQDAGGNNTTAPADGGSDTGPTCESHRVGSCMAADGSTCMNFDGTYFTASNIAMSCPDGTLQQGCACPSEGATGICHVFPGLANEHGKVYYSDDVETAVLDCQDPLSLWESTDLTPDISNICSAGGRTFRASNGTYSECAMNWACGGPALRMAVSCERVQQGDTFTYDCACDEDGSVTSEFQLEDACGDFAATDEENDAALRTVVIDNCGWSVLGE